MKHKKFQVTYPYTYYLKDIETGQKYHGVRWGNLKINKCPIEDFGKRYFTSGKMSKKFKKEPNKFIFRLCWTFDTVEEARSYESKVNNRLMKKEDWEVWNDSKSIYNKIGPNKGKKLKETTKKKISEKNKGKIRSEEYRKLDSEIQRSKVGDGSHYWLTDKHSKLTSKRMKENNPSHGGLKEEHKRKIGESCSKSLLEHNKNNPRTEEHKKNLSIALKGLIPWNKGKTGVQKCSDETRQKLRLSKLGKKRGPYKKKDKNVT